MLQILLICAGLIVAGFLCHGCAYLFEDRELQDPDPIDEERVNYLHDKSERAED